MKHEISDQSVVKAKKNQVSCNLEGEAVILGMETGTYYGLDEVGTRIWELLQEPRAVSDIMTTLLNEYEVEPECCQKDVMEFIHQMHTAGLVEVQNGTPA